MPGYSEIVLDHAESPSNVGRLEDANVVGTTGSPGRPPFMTMDFHIKNGIVAEVRYRTYGCAPAIAAGSVLTEMIQGRTIEEALSVTEQQLADALGGLPPGKTWCVELALGTMRNALEGHRSGDASASARGASRETNE